MAEVMYTFGNLKKVIRESTDEFNPKKGEKVESGNEKNNEKAVRDIEEKVKSFDGGNLEVLVPKANGLSDGDRNLSTLDIEFDVKPSKEYTDRVKAQVHGFPSKQNEENSDIEKENGGVDFDGNRKLYKDLKARNKELKGNKADIKHAGLKSHNLDKSEFEHPSAFNESKQQKTEKMKRLYFKKTTFLSEQQMINRIPEDYKKDGNKFIMKDSADNEYIVEWNVNMFGQGEAKVLNHTNKHVIKEQLNRINELFNYDRSEVFNTTNRQTRINEDKMTNELVSEAKKLSEQMQRKK